jgi:hypothetical protein
MSFPIHSKNPSVIHAMSFMLRALEARQLEYNNNQQGFITHEDIDPNDRECISTDTEFKRSAMVLVGENQRVNLAQHIFPVHYPFEFSSLGQNEMCIIGPQLNINPNLPLEDEMKKMIQILINWKCRRTGVTRKYMENNTGPREIYNRILCNFRNEVFTQFILWCRTNNQNARRLIIYARNPNPYYKHGDADYAQSLLMDEIDTTLYKTLFTGVSIECNGYIKHTDLIFKNLDISVTVKDVDDGLDLLVFDPLYSTHSIPEYKFDISRSINLNVDYVPSYFKTYKYEIHDPDPHNAAFICLRNVICGVSDIDEFIQKLITSMCECSHISEIKCTATFQIFQGINLENKLLDLIRTHFSVPGQLYNPGTSREQRLPITTGNINRYLDYRIIPLRENSFFKLIVYP